MQVALIGSNHPYLAGMRKALMDAGHTVHTDLASHADHIIVDGRALSTLEGDLSRLAALVHHPDKRAVERLGAVRRIIATSEPVGERLVGEYGLDPERISVVTPGVDASLRVPGNTKGCHLLAIGALIPRKGHDILLRALARLFDLDWHLTIVGSAERDPEHARALAALACEPSLAGRVHLVTTDVDAEALEALWQSADVFALATNWEGYGMAVAEALRRGLPVAVTSGGQAAALVTASAGVVCPPGDHEGLSKALRRLIFDQVLRAEMRDAAWAIGQTLPGWHTQAAALLAALR
jgi:glycosyltransferase involved in cell wall biosynthesis